MYRSIHRSAAQIVLPLVLLVAPVFIPIYPFEFDIPTLLTVVSLEFAILVGFFIAAATTNYLRLQSLIADEDSALISMFRLGKVVQPSIAPKLRQAIDDYATHALDFELSEYVEKTKDQFNALTSLLDHISPKGNREMELLGNIQDKEDLVIRTRQEITLVSRKVVTGLHWTVLISLDALLVFLLLSLRNGDLILSLIVGILSASVYLVLVLLHEIDSNAFLEEMLAYQDTQMVFEAIGTMKYLPEMALENKRVTKPKEDYRLGALKGNSEFVEREIKIIHGA